MFSVEFIWFKINFIGLEPMPFGVSCWILAWSSPLGPSKQEGGVGRSFHRVAGKVPQKAEGVEIHTGTATATTKTQRRFRQ